MAVTGWESVSTADWEDGLCDLPCHDYQHFSDYVTRSATVLGGDVLLLRHKSGPQVAVRILTGPLRALRVGYIPAGIATVGEIGNPHEFELILRDLRIELQSQGLVPVIRFPAILESMIPSLSGLAEIAGFAPDRSARRWTYQLRVDCEIDSILENTQSQWRSNVRRAQRNSLRVEILQDESDWNRMQEGLSGLQARKKFDVTLDAAFFYSLEASRQASRILLLGAVAPEQEDPVAMAVVSIQGASATYLLGYSAPTGALARGGPELVQLHAIEHARELGARFYDLGGVDWVGNRGVFDFKRRMGGRLVCSSGTYVGMGGRLRQSLAASLLTRRKNGR